MKFHEILKFLKGEKIATRAGENLEKPFSEAAWTKIGAWKIKISEGLGNAKNSNSNALEAASNLEESVPAALLKLVERAPSEILQSGRERVSKEEVFLRGNAKIVVLKRYKRQNFFQSRAAILRGSKAERAFRAAEILRSRGLGTPPPIAVLERWRGKILEESFLITEFVPALTNFRDEMWRIFREESNTFAINSLLGIVAENCRKFHDCGLVHRDLGNQNIALRRRGNGEFDVLFVDLDRVRFLPEISFSDRGNDLARISLPSDFLRVFFTLYFENYDPPKEFSRAQKSARKKFEIHSKLRPLRHPFREWKIRKKERAEAQKLAPEKRVPTGQDLWIWDEKSAQAVHAFETKDRRKFRSKSTFFAIFCGLLKFGVPAWKRFKIYEKNPKKIAAPDFRKSVGIALEAVPEAWEIQLNLLRELQSNESAEMANFRMPVLLRIYHHKPQLWRFTIEKARELHELGNDVALALVQDRNAILRPDSWRKMVELAFAGTADFADFIEVGHAVKRTIWGIWSLADFKKLLVPVVEQKTAFPRVKIVGPACIDFDVYSLPSFLSALPKGFHFDEISQHLYVDRRGDPANFQGKFDTFRKIALLAAFAKAAGTPSEKIVISEVNWPLENCEEFSPVDSPVLTKGPWGAQPNSPWQTNPPRVSEEKYAEFMEKYLKIALESGLVSKIFWWRLLAKGFGLVDDGVPARPRKRPAFFVLKKILRENAAKPSSEI